MAYEISFRPAAQRELAALDRGIQSKIIATIAALAIEPRPSGVKKLKGSDALYRVRVSDYRIIYQLNDGALIICIISVGHRREVYR